MGGGEFRRRYERKNYSTDVIFSLNGKAFAGTLRDISMGGAFLLSLSVAEISPGDMIIVSIPFTTGKRNIKRRARVSWVGEDGFAVEFV